MVRAPVIGLALLSLCVAPALAYPVEVTGDAVRVRAAPGGAVLGTVGRGQRFEVDQQRQGWVRVDWRGRDAWVSAQLVRRVAAGGGAAATPVSRGDLEVLARIIKGEANHCSFEGKVAVAAVVLNRVRARGFPKTIPGVAHQPWQFSCYNPNVRARLYHGPVSAACWEAARAAVAGRDPTRGATYYFNPYLVKPSWARSMRFLVRLGTTRSTTHDFYAPR
jgi:hypothetical protein